MGVRPLVAAVAVSAAFAVPAIVLADVGPHANAYAQHPGAGTSRDNVELVVHRDTQKADLYVTNFCLGSESFPGSPGKEPHQASARGVQVHKGKVSYKGNGTISTPNGEQQVAMQFVATIKTKSAKGTAKFPGTQCGTISFKAKLTKRTK